MAVKFILLVRLCLIKKLELVDFHPKPSVLFVILGKLQKNEDSIILFSDAPYIVWGISIYQVVCLSVCVSGHLNRFGQMNLGQNLHSVSIS